MPSQQLSVELGRALAGPASALLGRDLAEMIRARTAERAATLACGLAGDDDQAVQTARDIIGCLWPHAAPEDCGEAGWWRTPLGVLCARSLARGDAGHVTQAVAGAMLGVTRDTVATLVQRGSLDRHPDGGVDRASVMRRLVRLHDRGKPAEYVENNES